MFRLLWFVSICLLISFTCTPTRSISESNAALKIDKTIRSDFRILFYNVENLFDPFNDSLTNDDEFLPLGVRHWTWERYREKCIRIGKVIVAVGGEEAPELIGLCELENRFVLEGIFQFGPLVKLGYKIIHRDSPDRRGIDVALMYQPERFRVLDQRFLQVHYKKQKSSTTREILYAKGLTMTEDTLHVFVNHWPSRWGGQKTSEHKRLEAARTLRTCLDSIRLQNPEAKIVVMGDFNDYPENSSVSSVLGAMEVDEKHNSTVLINLAKNSRNNSLEGSHKYQGHWGMLDQIMVSASLLNGSAYLQCQPDDFHVFRPPYLLEKDEVYLGQKPFRTYIGFRYQGGFSDHLPVYLDLWRK